MEQGFAFQRIWSVAAAAQGGDPCIPASATGFYDVTQQPGTPSWLPIAAGKSVKIPLVGWATTAGTPPWWLLSSYVSESSAGLASATTKVSSAKTGTFSVACGASPIADNAGAAGAPTVTVTAPAGAASGDWAVVEIDSYRQDVAATCSATPGTDLRRFWSVGVYVP